MEVPCDCMVRQDNLGQIVCRKCNGDWYACECEGRHSRHCESAWQEANLFLQGGASR